MCCTIIVQISSVIIKFKQMTLLILTMKQKLNYLLNKSNHCDDEKLLMLLIQKHSLHE